MTGRVYLYSISNDSLSLGARVLKPEDNRPLFGEQLEMDDNWLVVTTDHWYEKAKDSDDVLWYQDIYSYALQPSGVKENKKFVQQVSESDKGVPVELIKGFLVTVGYDQNRKLRTLNVYKNDQEEWQLVDQVFAPENSVEFGYTLQAAGDDLMVSERGKTPKVSIYQLSDDGKLTDTGDALIYPEQDSKPGFGDLMAFDDKYLYVARRGVTGEVNNYPGKVFVYKKQEAAPYVDCANCFEKGLLK